MLPALQQRAADLVISDLQIGSMGGFAMGMQRRLELRLGRLRPGPRAAVARPAPDTFMAKRIGVAGWLVKPLDPLRIRAAAKAVLAGGQYFDTTLAAVPPDVLPA